LTRFKIDVIMASIFLTIKLWKSQNIIINHQMAS